MIYDESIIKLLYDNLILLLIWVYIWVAPWGKRVLCYIIETVYDKQRNCILLPPLIKKSALTSIILMQNNSFLVSTINRNSLMISKNLIAIG